jgi:hypothetical protein
MKKAEKPAPKIIIETMEVTGMTQAEAAEHLGLPRVWLTPDL